MISVFYFEMVDRLSVLRQQASVEVGETQPLLARGQNTSKMMAAVAGLSNEATESIEDCQTTAHNIAVLSKEMRGAGNGKEERRLVSEMQAMVVDSKNYISQAKRCLTDLELLLGKKSKNSNYFHMNGKSSCNRVK